MLEKSATALHRALIAARAEEWDVLTLGYARFNFTSTGAGAHVWRGIVEARDTTGATGYVVRRQYLPRMLQWLEAGVAMLEVYNTPSTHALDTWWSHLHARDTWRAPVPPLIHPAASWSNIEFTFVDRAGKTRGWIQLWQTCQAHSCIPGWLQYAWFPHRGRACECGMSVGQRVFVRFRQVRGFQDARKLWGAHAG